MVDEPTASATVRVKIHTPLPADHPSYALIGRVTSEWSQLEHPLDSIIWALLGMETSLTACVTGQLMGAAPRFNAIIALATRKKINENAIAEIRTVMQRTFDVQEERNRLVHDPWLFDADSQQTAQWPKCTQKDVARWFARHQRR